MYRTKYEEIKDRAADFLHRVADRLDGGSWRQSIEDEGHFQGLKEGRSSWQRLDPDQIGCEIEVFSISDGGKNVVQMAFMDRYGRSQYRDMTPEDATALAKAIIVAAN